MLVVSAWCAVDTQDPIEGTALRLGILGRMEADGVMGGQFSYRDDSFWGQQCKQGL